MTKSITSDTSFNLFSLSTYAAAAFPSATEGGGGVLGAYHSSATPESSPNGVRRPRISREELVSILEEAFSVDDNDDFNGILTTTTSYDSNRDCIHHDRHHQGSSSSSDQSSAQ
jgi:hypothetical protein